MDSNDAIPLSSSTTQVRSVFLEPSDDVRGLLSVGHSTRKALAGESSIGKIPAPVGIGTVETIVRAHAEYLLARSGSLCRLGWNQLDRIRYVVQIAERRRPEYQVLSRNCWRSDFSPIPLKLQLCFSEPTVLAAGFRY